MWKETEPPETVSNSNETSIEVSIEVSFLGFAFKKQGFVSSDICADFHISSFNIAPAILHINQNRSD